MASFRRMLTFTDKLPKILEENPFDMSSYVCLYRFPRKSLENKGKEMPIDWTMQPLVVPAFALKTYDYINKLEANHYNNYMLCWASLQDVVPAIQNDMPGYVDTKPNAGGTVSNQALLDQLAEANKRVAVLEKRVNVSLRGIQTVEQTLANVHKTINGDYDNE